MTAGRFRVFSCGLFAVSALHSFGITGLCGDGCEYTLGPRREYGVECAQRRGQSHVKGDLGCYCCIRLGHVCVSKRVQVATCQIHRRGSGLIEMAKIIGGGWVYGTPWVLIGVVRLVAKPFSSAPCLGIRNL